MANATLERRPHFQTAQRQALLAKSRARREEFEQFFHQHLSTVRERLRAACKPHDKRRRNSRKKRLQQALDEDEPVYGIAGYKPQLWEIDGEAE